ncbi:MAG: DoxX family protein [Fluviicola sp.]
MEFLSQYHQIVAITIARVFLGLLFVFQGYDAVFGIGMSRVTATYQAGFSPKGIPGIFTAMAAWFTSYTELICGFFLLIGLFEYASLYLLGLNLIIAAAGFGMNNPLWDTRHVFPRLILLLILLFTPFEWHAWSFDHFLTL